MGKPRNDLKSKKQLKQDAKKSLIDIKSKLKQLQIYVSSNRYPLYILMGKIMYYLAFADAGIWWDYLGNKSCTIRPRLVLSTFNKRLAYKHTCIYCMFILYDPYIGAIPRAIPRGDTIIFNRIFRAKNFSKLDHMKTKN